MYKVNWYTLCWNENDIVKYVIDYWKAIKNQVDLKVIVYDNGSDDGCLNELSKYDWIEIRVFHTSGLDDYQQADIKNNCWKESKNKVDYVIISDFDEILWGNLQLTLDNMKNNDCNILCTKWYAFCGDFVPTYTKNKYLHQLIKRGYKQSINWDDNYKEYGKFMLIDPNKIDDMNWWPGNHFCNPKPIKCVYLDKNIIAFHINKGFSKEYYYIRNKILYKRQSKSNLENNMGIHLGYSKEKMFEEYENHIKESIDISNL